MKRSIKVYFQPMGRSDRRGDISKDTQSQSGQIIFWFLVILASALLMFVIIWFMFRLNYKLTQLRENFWPVVGRIALALLVIILLFVLFVFVLNLVSRRRYSKETDENDD